jgi:hypothetical protein
VIVVVGQPFARRGPSGWVADGAAVRVAAAALEVGGRVELLGRIGDDPVGEALVLDLARRGIGHAAVIRSPGRPTPVLDDRPGGGEPLGLDAGDVELGLRYFVDLAAVAIVDPLPEAAVGTAVQVALAQDAALVVAVERGAPPPATALEGVPNHVVLEAPGPDGRPAFDRLVGRLVARLAAGVPVGEVFREEAAATGWQPVVLAHPAVGSAGRR